MCHALVIEDDFLAADYLAALAELAGVATSEIAQTEGAAVAAAIARRSE